MTGPRRPIVVNKGGPGFDFGKFKPTGAATGAVWAVLILIFLIWLWRGGPAYTVTAGEEGVVLTFGKYTKSTQPGMHFKLPWPIQTVEKVDVSSVMRIEIGFETKEGYDSNEYRTFTNDPTLLSEAQMLTGDENVVDCSMSIQYRVTNSQAYLFNYRPEVFKGMLKSLGEAALRQAVGDHPINDVLTTGKVQIMAEIKVKMQELADLTGAGISIQDVYLQDVQPPREVADSFRDVASAREEREKLINEARAYQSEQLPKAEGQAQQKRLESMGFKEARVAEATGEVARFKAIAKQYSAAPEITRSKLYLETMAELLPRMRITVMDKNSSIVNLKSFTEQFYVPQQPADATQEVQQ
jgi:membrane protease subunit HflK